MAIQISMPGFSAPESGELRFLEQIMSALGAAVEMAGGLASFLSVNPTGTDDSNGYTALFLGNFTVARVHLRGKQHHISVPAIFSDLIPAEYPQKQIRSNGKYIRLLIDAQHPVESYTAFLCLLAGETMNRYPKEWDCCSRYMECSNAKHGKQYGFSNKEFLM